MSHDRRTFQFLDIRDAHQPPQTMSKSTLDYSNNIAFDNFESFKSLVGVRGGGGG